MATLTVSNPEVVGGPPMEMVKKLILNGQHWSAGEFLNQDNNGLLNECATDDDAGTGGGIKYYAITAQTDPGNSTTEAEVGIITSEHIFEGNELNGAVSDANVGNQYGIDVSTHVVTIDVDDTTNPAVVIVDRGPQYNEAEYTTSDVKGKLRFKILTTVLEASPA